jgi:hypothetical protein
MRHAFMAAMRAAPAHGPSSIWPFAAHEVRRVRLSSSALRGTVRIVPKDSARV